MRLRSLYIIVFACFSFTGKAQLSDFLSLDTDSTFINDQSDKLLLRVFTMQKFNKYTLGQYGYPDNITYKANNNYHLGFGFHYKWIGANMSFKLPYFQRNNIGTTKFFDLQSYLYLNRIAIDLYVLSYKGYYLADDGVVSKLPPGAGTLIRRDLRTQNYGTNFQYIFNYKKFSYRAAFIQNQCQVKNAGSFIVGGSIHYTRVKADSAIVPPTVIYDGFFGDHTFNKTSALVLAVSGGYAYTYVFKKHFFITASLLLGTGLNYVALKTDRTDARDATLHAQLHGILRAAGGYNADNFFLGLQYSNYVSRNNTPVPDSWQQLQSGYIRLTFARRFDLNPKTARKLEQIENKIMPDTIK